MSNDNKFINVGIVAHVDAGKTSITEHFLHKSGIIRSIGSVDKGTSQTDWLAVERERGISVRSASASFKWNNININLIDTPGHIDFSSEVERSLRALDCAILVVSAVEGVQAHTENLWLALRKIDIPTIIFINKVDRIGADTISVIQEIKNELSSNIVCLQSVKNEASNKVEISDILKENNDELIESVVNNDEDLMERYLNDETISRQDLQKSLISQIHENILFPVLFGSAKFDKGIDELLEAITQLMPLAKGDATSPLSGVVFKIEHDKTIGRIASVRLFSGSIKNRDTIFIASQNKEEKISQIRKLQGQKYEDIGELSAGDTAAICGLNSIRAGDIIGSADDVNINVSLNTALLTVKVEPEKNEDFSELVRAMHMLTDEDPTIDLLWLKDERELHIKIMGLIQLEILESVLMERFKLKVNFGSPTVIYKETPKASVIGYEEYTMPKPCWAVVRFKIEPTERGSGIVYSSEVGVNKIAIRYQQEVERTIPLALKQGILGWEVTDLKITLIGDEDHNIHSRAGDFAVATPMGIMNGLKEIGTILLEPMLEFTITAPDQTLGKIASGLTLLRAEFGNPEIENEKFSLSGKIPVASSLDYSAKLSSITGGKGKFKTKFSCYRECPIELGATTEFRGISPLDRAKYILKARKAIQ
jgi:ribosomal protection tetracycline resistance protein